MIHTILYYGRLDLNFQRLRKLGDDFKIARPGSRDFTEVASPSGKVDGIVFGYMEKSHRGLGNARFCAVKVDDVVLDTPVLLKPERHTHGKGFGPRASQFGDVSARNLLADIIQHNPR